MKIFAALPFIFFVLPAGNLYAQTMAYDGPPQVETRKAVSYYPTATKDMMWAKRVWRTMDLREKFNHPLYYPETPAQGRHSLFDAVKAGLMSGEITGYDVDDNGVMFSVELSKGEVQQIFSSHTESVRGGSESLFEEPPLASVDVKAWWMMEDWFFDKQRSVMDVRIVGMCPLRERRTATGQVRGYQPMFWLYFEQMRPVLVRFTYFNTKNDASVLSYDDVFQKRMFASYIHKELTMYSSGTQMVVGGIESQLEAERIRLGLSTMEHDFWNY
ncbi:MAG: gliding motility protein GldN [Bacteroidia bacterium]|jgi:gliding motility associated protien GldN|nr:gliding motility protein GldN [Bacteroidia bacterium]